MICKNCCGENNNNEQFCKYCHSKLDNPQIRNMQLVANNQTQYIFSYKPVKKYNKKKVLLIISSIILLIAIIGILLWKNDNEVIHGQWYCKQREFNVEVNKNNATVHLTFEGNHFKWAENNKENTDYFEGTYRYKDYRVGSLTLERKRIKKDGLDSDLSHYTYSYDVKKDNKKMELIHEDYGSIWECIKY